MYKYTLEENKWFYHNKIEIQTNTLEELKEAILLLK